MGSNEIPPPAATVLIIDSTVSSSIILNDTDSRKNKSVNILRYGQVFKLLTTIGNCHIWEIDSQNLGVIIERYSLVLKIHCALVNT